MNRTPSNTAATTLLNQAGGEFLLHLLKSDKYNFYDEQKGGGLWVGKEYGKGKAYKRDPLYNISHGATAMQTARFLYLLETGNLVSLKSCQLMKGMMSRPGIHHKFVAGLLDKDPSARVFRKSGTWRTYHSDAAIIERDEVKYIAVGLANSPSGGKWLKSFIKGVDDLIQSRHKDSQASAE
jgi:beta-lactamase class A